MFLWGRGWSPGGNVFFHGVDNESDMQTKEELYLPIQSGYPSDWTKIRLGGKIPQKVVC